MFETHEEIRRFLASEEMWNDVDYMKSMDSMWHDVQQHPGTIRWLDKEREKDGKEDRTRRQEWR